MSLSLSLPLPFNSYTPFPNTISPFPISKPSPNHSLSRPILCFSLSSNSNYEREEARWLREEKRWLREEQRWLRQESHWLAERESLLREMETLNLRIQELERRQGEIQGVSVSEAVTKVATLLQLVVKEGDFGTTLNQLTDSGSSAVPMVVEAAMAEEVMVVKEVVEEGKKEVNKKRVTLRKGSEGEDVRAMQEALQKLGFYPEEEDLEYSSFSSGTERAVKTWQATLGAPEDGIMTAELQERLYMDHQLGISGLAVNTIAKGIGMAGLPEEAANGAAFASITEISEVQKTIVEEEGVDEVEVSEVEVSEHRVFLLGENRWEDSSRLTGRNKQGGTKSKDSKTKCLICCGLGRVLCTECDGSGEPNLEPQFMEWIEEGMKCPYCEGHGFTMCDVCEGKTVV